MHTRWRALVCCAALLTAATPAVAAGEGGASHLAGSSNRAGSGAQPTGPDARVTLTVQDSSLQYVVRELARQAHLHLVFTGGALFAQHVSVHLANVRVMDAYSEVLQGRGVTAKLAPDEETVVISASSGGSRGRGRPGESGGIIAGRVTDSTTGVGLRGAQVQVEGIARLSASSSDSGTFTLQNVPPGDQVLIVKLFGYRPASRTVTVVDNERTSVRVALAPIPTVLSGVVTTATGEQRRIEVGNDITTLNVDSIMRIAPITSVTDLLETRVPGLTVVHTSGTPGDPARLRLRGAGSVLLNNDPVVIVDGIRVYASQSDARNNNPAPSKIGGAATVIGSSFGGQPYAAPSPLDQIDPNSIETIEVFKGPSASAMYGSDAATGVIVITTKHGRAGPAHWSLNLGDGVNWIPGGWPTNTYTFDVVGPNDTIPCYWLNANCTANYTTQFQALNDPLYTVLTHGSDQTAALSISGGVPVLTYSITGSAAGDVGNLRLPAIEQQRYQQAYGSIPKWMIRPDNYRNWSVSGTLTAQPASTMQVTLSSQLFNSTQQRSSLENAISQLAGEYINNLGVLPAGYPYFRSFTAQPLLNRDVERAVVGNLNSTNALTLSWQPRSWLPITATGGINSLQQNGTTYIPFGVSSCGIGGQKNFGCDTTGYYGVGRNMVQDNTLNVGTTLPSPHLQLSAGGNIHAESNTDFNAYTNLLAPGVSTPTTFPTTGCQQGTGTCSSFSQQARSNSTYGWYVEPRFNISQRFFIAPGFRLDGGSGGSHINYGGGGLSSAGLSAFPKVDLSWVAVDQQGGRPLWGVFSLLRPRLAFGLAGDQPAIENKLRLINSQGTQAVVPLSDTTTGPVAVIQTLGNNELRPERARELDGGLDATLWNGRLTFLYTRYNKTTKDAIMNVPAAPSIVGAVSTGFVLPAILYSPGTFGGSGFTNSTFQKNVGEVRNTGTELTVDVQVMESHALAWHVGTKLSKNNNMLVHLNAGQSPFCADGTPGQGGVGCIAAGYPLFGTWERPILGFADVNHDGRITPGEFVVADSAVYTGQPEPTYELNLTSDLTLLNGRLGVHTTFAYQNGMTQYNEAALSSGALLMSANNATVPLATQAAVAAAVCQSSTFFFRCGDATALGAVQTVNVFRFDALSIDYQVPRSVATWFRVPRMTLALQGSNLGLHTNYRGKDPGVNAFSSGSQGDRTLDNGQIPAPRTWWLKVNVSN